MISLRTRLLDSFGDLLRRLFRACLGQRNVHKSHARVCIKCHQSQRILLLRRHLQHGKYFNTQDFAQGERLAAVVRDQQCELLLLEHTLNLAPIQQRNGGFFTKPRICQHQHILAGLASTVAH